LRSGPGTAARMLSDKVGAGLFLAVVMYLASTATAGKCSGKWAIHACGGGNGKRSEAEYSLKEILSRGNFADANEEVKSRKSEHLDQLSDSGEELPLGSRQGLDKSVRHHTEENDEDDDLADRNNAELKEAIREDASLSSVKQDRLLRAIRLISRLEERRKFLENLRHSDDVSDDESA